MSTTYLGEPTSLLGGVTTQSAASEWRRKVCSLPLAAGWLRLGRISFPALCARRDFLREEDSADPGTVAAETVDPSVQAIFVPALPVQDRKRALSFSRRYIRYIPAQYKRYYADLRTSFDDYLLKNFSQKSRETLRRKVRKLAAASGGSVVFREYRTPLEMQDFYAQARRVSAKTYQEKMDCGLPSSKGFQDTLRELATTGQVRGYLLFVGQEAISYLCCPIDEGAVEYAYLGYDPELAHLCPGTVLQYLAMERLFAEKKFDIFDFTEGEGPHKELFATGSRDCADVYYFRWSVRNAFLVAAHYGLAGASRILSSAITKAGLKRKLRDAVRRKGNAAGPEALQAGATS